MEAERSSADRLADLYDRYHARVLAFCLLRAEESAAEEVAGETFLIAWRKLSSLPDPPLPWLLGVARNLLRKQYGAQMRRNLLEQRLAVLSDHRDQQEWDVAEHVVAREAAVAALAQLPERHTEALVLVAWHGLSPAEAGKVVGCSATTFSVRLHRARKALAKKLEFLERTSAPARRENAVPPVAGRRAARQEV